MIEIEFPPDFVSLTFESMNRVFASIGNYGSVVNIWDSYTYNLVNSIPTKGFIIQDLTFVPYTSHIIVLTSDCSLRFYDIEKKGGELLR